MNDTRTNDSTRYKYWVVQKASKYIIYHFNWI